MQSVEGMDTSTELMRNVAEYVSQSTAHSSTAHRLRRTEFGAHSKRMYYTQWMCLRTLPLTDPLFLSLLPRLAPRVFSIGLQIEAFLVLLFKSFLRARAFVPGPHRARVPQRCRTRRVGEGRKGWGEPGVGGGVFSESPPRWSPS